MKKNTFVLTLMSCCLTFAIMACTDNNDNPTEIENPDGHTDPGQYYAEQDSLRKEQLYDDLITNLCIVDSESADYIPRHGVQEVNGGSDYFVVVESLDEGRDIFRYIIPFDDRESIDTLANGDMVYQIKDAVITYTEHTGGDILARISIDCPLLPQYRNIKIYSTTQNFPVMAGNNVSPFKRGEIWKKTNSNAYYICVLDCYTSKGALVTFDEGCHIAEYSERRGFFGCKKRTQRGWEGMASEQAVEALARMIVSQQIISVSKNFCRYFWNNKAMRNNYDNRPKTYKALIDDSYIYKKYVDRNDPQWNYKFDNCNISSGDIDDNVYKGELFKGKDIPYGNFKHWTEIHGDVYGYIRQWVKIITENGTAFATVARNKNWSGHVLDVTGYSWYDYKPYQIVFDFNTSTDGWEQVL